MFSRLAAVSALAFVVLAAAAGNCNTGSMQCCQRVEDSKSTSGSALLSAMAGLGINVQDVTGKIGLDCSPLSVVGVGAGNACSASPVCCQNNNVGGAVSMGCVPISL